MAQGDLNVANQSGAAFRADLNNQLLALGTLMSGASEPSTMYAYMLWADTTAGLLKQRNAANNAWVTLGTLGSANLGLLPSGSTLIAALGSAGTPGVTFTGDTDTGLYSPGANQVALGTSGQQRLAVDSSGRVLVGPGSAREVGGAVIPTLSVESLSQAAAFVRNSNDTSGGIVALGKSRGAAAGGVTAVQNGDILGELRFCGANGTDLTSIGAHIRAVVNGEVGTAGDATDMPTQLVFSTTPDGQATAAQRLAINTTGIQVSGDAQIESLNGGPLAGTRNRIINGDMRIDQRNAGATVTLPAATVTYVVDRWAHFEDTDGTATVQRSTVAPAGFTNSLLITTTAADASLSATQRLTTAQVIEGFNAADLGWGAAGASSVTLSFWVRSSLTGTFGGAVKNGANTRAYPFTYSISSANTWEYKTVVIPGDTTGTWPTDNSPALAVNFGLGVGTTFSGTAGSWQAADLNSATGAVSVIGTLNATWQITGVQLEAGTVATPFERRSYGQELALCQRYYYKTDKNFSLQSYGVAAGGNTYAHLTHPVPMRAAPTATNSFASGINNQSQTVTLSAQAFTLQLVSNASGDYAVVYSTGNTMSAEL